MKTILEIKQLGEIIQKSLPNEIVRVIGEISQPKLFRGNLYLNLKDKFCNIKSIIWKNTLEEFSNEVKDGDKIIVDGKLDFYGGNGGISFIINKLIEYHGEGEMFKLYQKYKKDFENKGYYLPNEKLNLPEKIKNIAIVTSQNGAAIQDIIYTFDNNLCNVDYDIFNVPVQGNTCPGSIIKELNNLENESYDLVFISRGGGSFEDLFGFSNPELIEVAHNFNKPILSAVGHQTDTSILDLVADVSAPTPSLGAQLIIDTNRKYVNKLEDLKNTIRDTIINTSYQYLKDLNACNDRINRIILFFDKISINYQNELLKSIDSYIFKLKELDIRLNNFSNSDDIIILSDNKKLTCKTFQKILNSNKNFQIKWGGKIINILDYNFSIE